MMRNIIMLTMALAVGTAGYNASVRAQDTTQASTIAAEKPFTVSITPRLWYQMANGNSYHSDPAHQSTVTQTNFADYGLSAEVSAKSLPRWSFILTGYYGGGSSPARALDFLPNAFGPGTFDLVAENVASSAYSRYDVEVLARYLVAPTISLTGGIRTFNFSDKITSHRTNIFPNTFFEDIVTSFVQKSNTQFYFAELGVLFSTPFAESGRHLLFGGTTLGLGAETTTFSQLGTRSSAKFFAATLDVYAGYQFLLTESLALNLRYRAIMFSVNQVPGQVTVTHGPEIGLTYRF